MPVPFGLRAKVVLISLLVSVLVSFAIGTVLYLRSYGLFFSRFSAEKLNLARTVALSLDGDGVAGMTDPAALDDPLYGKDLRFLRSVKALDEDISFIYVIRYNEETRCHVYVLDGNVNAENVLWVETASVYLICTILPDGSVTIENEQVVHDGDFAIETDSGTVHVRFAGQDRNREILLDGELLFRVVSGSPIALETPWGGLSAAMHSTDLTLHGSVAVAGANEDLSAHLGLKGDPESMPGDVYNQNDAESIQGFLALADTDSSYASQSFEGSTYGATIFVYTPVHGDDGSVEGILCLEIWAREAVTYSRTILLTTILVAALAFVLSVIVYLFMIEELVVKGIAKLTLGIRQIGAGNLDHRVVLKRSDEIGLLAQTFNEMADGLKEKERVKDLFGKLVEKEVEVLGMSSKVDFAGVKREATVLFCDIRSFTTLSDSMDAQDLVVVLNRYFAHMVSAVVENHGVLDKYIGDAIMAHFGVLGSSDRPADDAVCCGVRMVRGLSDFNAGQRESGGPELRIGIGIHTGDLVAGNMGSANRMEYTVIGDTVNLASRAESLTRLFGTPLVITGDTLSHLRDRASYRLRPLDQVVVKGKSVPVHLHEVFDGDPEAVREAKIADTPRYTAALEAYHARRFAEAAEVLGGLSAARPDDEVYRYFLEKCRYYGAHLPGDDWDGSTVMAEK